MWAPAYQHICLCFILLKLRFLFNGNYPIKHLTYASYARYVSCWFHVQRIVFAEASVATTLELTDKTARFEKSIRFIFSSSIFNATILHLDMFES